MAEKHYSDLEARLAAAEAQLAEMTNRADELDLRLARLTRVMEAKHSLTPEERRAIRRTNAALAREAKRKKNGSR